MPVIVFIRISLVSASAEGLNVGVIGVHFSGTPVITLTSEVSQFLLLCIFQVTEFECNKIHNCDFHRTKACFTLCLDL